MLAVVAFWATVPASACLLASHAIERPDCCSAMAGACESQAMGADNSCCQIHGKNLAIVPTPVYSPQHERHLAVLPLHHGVQRTPALGSGFVIALETPPPKFPPGGAFALRI